MRRGVRVVRVPLVGKGIHDDPFRANLPTYRLVSVDARSGFAVVEITDADLDPRRFGEFDRFDFKSVEPHK